MNTPSDVIQFLKANVALFKEFTDERLGDLGKGVRAELEIDDFAGRQAGGQRRFAMVGEVFLGFAGARQKQTGILDG